MKAELISTASSNAGKRKLISVVTPCYNEQENVVQLYESIKAVFQKLPNYQYEQIFIDNSSTDRTVERIRKIAAEDKNVKLIVNTRNFGHIRSPLYGLLQSRGDAVVAMASDLQDPPEMIVQFIEKWEQGFLVVAGVKPKSEETFLMALIRRSYYHFLARISEVHLIKNFTGFGLYDGVVIDAIRKLKDPYPYFRGLIAELGFKAIEIPFVQPPRVRGITKNNFYTLYDMAMLGITTHSRVPMRLATMTGFGLAAISLLISLTYLVLKLIFWNSFSIGSAPILVGLFFFSSVQLIFIGLLGEYVGAILTQVLDRPLVVEKERINFEETNEIK
ncbi:MAG: glycosyltransferase family 2 protein [Pseudomonadota bacterium]